LTLKVRLVNMTFSCSHLLVSHFPALQPAPIGPLPHFPTLPFCAVISTPAFPPLHFRLSRILYSRVFSRRLSLLLTDAQKLTDRRLTFLLHFIACQLGLYDCGRYQNFSVETAIETKSVVWRPVWCWDANMPGRYRWSELTAILLAVAEPSKMRSAPDCRWHKVDSRRVTEVERRVRRPRSSTCHASLIGSRMTTPPNTLISAATTYRGHS